MSGLYTKIDSCILHYHYHSLFHPIIDSDFLKIARTAKQIADRIEATAQVTIPPGRITAELRKAPRNTIVQTIPGNEWGGNVNKYVLKTHYKAGD